MASSPSSGPWACQLRQLSLWLSIESIFLLGVGLAAGFALGFLLAWLVLPFATLTQTGLRPIPAPEVIVRGRRSSRSTSGPSSCSCLSLWLVRRQLLDIRISGVLRAREELSPMSSILVALRRLREDRVPAIGLAS